MEQRSIPRRPGGGGSISASTRERAEAAKAYIQGKYFKLKRQDSEKKESWDELNHKMSSMNLSDPEKQMIRQEVHVVRNKQTGEIQAMKKMIKSEMLCKNQVMHVRSERNVLSIADTSWIVELKYSFQDEKNLYLVMEFLPGGDLMTILMKRDILPEDEAKFYIAETIIAVDNVHKLNYIHRDIKPDNVLDM